VRRIVFLADHIRHYHRPILRAIEQRVKAQGGAFTLLTAGTRRDIPGKATLASGVVDDHRRYPLYERSIMGFAVRHQVGVIETIRRMRPDVIVTMAHAGTLEEWRLAALKRSLGFRLVAWQCGYEYHPGWFKDRVLSRFVPLFDHHLAYHTNAKRYAMRHGAAESQVTVMHNTIDERRIERLDKAEARRRLEARFPGLAGRTIVLSVGALMPEKRVELAIDALGHARDPRLALLVVGDGAHRARLAARCAGRPDVIFAGQILDGVGELFDGADMFVLPGTGGLALNEAMAHGLPLVSGYADGSADDLVQDGVNGFRLREETPEELADRLRTLADDAGLRARMGAASRELITTRFSFDRFAETVIRVLDTMGANGNGHG
jgi:glycosyltransferase involved in cell wall biosynthesis